MNHQYYDGVIQILAIIVPVFCTTIVGLITFGVRQIIRNLSLQIDKVAQDISDHRIKCDQISKEVLAKQIETLEVEIEKSRRFAHWIGDTIIIIASKTNTLSDISERPM